MRPDHDAVPARGLRERRGAATPGLRDRERFGKSRCAKNISSAWHEKSLGTIPVRGYSAPLVVANRRSRGAWRPWRNDFSRAGARCDAAL